MNIDISTNNLEFAKDVRLRPINGVAVMQSPIKMGFTDCSAADAIAVTANIDLQITIDLTQVTYAVVTGWLASRSKLFSGKHYIKVNGDDIPIDNPEAIGRIEKIINSKKNDK